MGKELYEMSLEELWQLFPIFLTEHQVDWQHWYAEEAVLLQNNIPQAKAIHHIGSTAIPGIWAKPIIDILLEVPHTAVFGEIEEMLKQQGYLCMNKNSTRMSFNKGYTKTGFEKRVFHLHVRYAGDHDELYFRDYLVEHAEAAKAYEALKLALWKQYPHDRDAYTAQKTEFVLRHTQAAKCIYGCRYESEKDDE